MPTGTKAKLASDKKNKTAVKVSNDVLHEHTCPYCTKRYDHKLAPRCLYKGLSYRSCEECYREGKFTVPEHKENDGTHTSIPFPGAIPYLVMLGEPL